MKACPHCNEINGHHKFNCPEKQLESIVVMGPTPPPTTEEAELWKEVRNIIMLWQDGDIPPEGYVSLRNKFSLRRRSEQNSEAIEFAEWIVKYQWTQSPQNDLWNDFEGWLDNRPPLTTAELFQLFKQNP